MDTVPATRTFAEMVVDLRATIQDKKFDNEHVQELYEKVTSHPECDPSTAEELFEFLYRHRLSVVRLIKPSPTASA